MEKKLPVLIVIAIVALAAVFIAIMYDDQGNKEETSYDLAQATDGVINEWVFKEYKIFEGDGYVWFFEDDAKITGTIDLTVRQSRYTFLDPTSPLSIRANCRCLMFDYDSDLPEGTMLRYDMGSEMANKWFAFFLEEDETDTQFVQADKDGTVELRIDHCDERLLVPAYKVNVELGEGVNTKMENLEWRCRYGVQQEFSFGVDEGYDIGTLTISDGVRTYEVFDTTTLFITGDLSIKATAEKINAGENDAIIDMSNIEGQKAGNMFEYDIIERSEDYVKDRYLSTVVTAVDENGFFFDETVVYICEPFIGMSGSHDGLYNNYADLIGQPDRQEIAEATYFFDGKEYDCYRIVLLNNIVDDTGSHEVMTHIYMGLNGVLFEMSQYSENGYMIQTLTGFTSV